jgi:hypothetical protein
MGILYMILGVLNGRKTDDEVTKVSCALAKLNNQKLKMIFVITITRNLPVDKEVNEKTIIAEQSLKNMEKLARDFKVRQSGEIIQARFQGSAVVQQINEVEAGILVIGLPQRKPHGQYNANRSVRYIYDNAGCVVVTCQSN